MWLRGLTGSRNVVFWASGGLRSVSRFYDESLRFICPMKKLSYLECTTTRRQRSASGWTIFILGFGLGGVCVYGLTRIWHI